MNKSKKSEDTLVSYKSRYWFYDNRIKDIFTIDANSVDEAITKAKDQGHADFVLRYSCSI